MSFEPRGATFRVATCAALLFAIGCGSSAEPNPATARIDLITADDQVVTINVDGSVTNGPLVVRRVLATRGNGTDSLVTDSVAVAARFRRSDGSLDPAILPENYLLVFTPQSNGVVFHRESAFSGQLVGSAIGTVIANVCLARRSDTTCTLVQQANLPVSVEESRQSP